MTAGYRWASALAIALYFVAAAASYYGWGLSSDASALAQARGRSVRGGSLHHRSFFGGGPGFGK